MAQSIVTVRLNGQPYQMGCDAGEEAHIEALAKEVDEILQSLTANAGQLGDTRLLAMAALILADQKHQAISEKTGVPAGQNGAAADSDRLAEQIEAMTTKLTDLTARLAKL